MLKPGIYLAENDESIWDSYKITMEVKETEKSYIFRIFFPFLYNWNLHDTEK